MSIEIRAGGPHASDGELVHVIDREGDAEERERILSHIAACAPCAERIERIRHRSARLRELLGAWDVGAVELPEPPLPRSDLERVRARHHPVPLRGWMRAAAGILLLLGIGMSVSPLRAWMVERWADVTGLLAGTEHVDESASTQAPAAGHVVSFLPEGDEFLLQIDASQAEGVLELLIEEVPRASAEISASAAGENLLVLPGGLRIRNAEGSQASYRVTLPAELRQVRVRIGEGPALSYDPRTLTPPVRRVLDLRRGGRQ